MDRYRPPDVAPCRLWSRQRRLFNMPISGFHLVKMSHSDNATVSKGDVVFVANDSPRICPSLPHTLQKSLEIAFELLLVAVSARFLTSLIRE
jgi:hypothetical protein